VRLRPASRPPFLGKFPAAIVFEEDEEGSFVEGHLSLFLILDKNRHPQKQGRRKRTIKKGEDVYPRDSTHPEKALAEKEGQRKKRKKEEK